MTNTYGNLRDFLMNVTISLTIMQYISIGCKPGSPILQRLWT